MTIPFIDTDLLIRYLSGDDPEKQERVALLLERVEGGEEVIAAPDTVIADAVYVLTSKRLYALPRQQVADMLSTLVRLPGFRIENGSAVLGALHVFAGDPRLDFGDAMIVASMRDAGSTELYSYDRDFNRVSGITRHEP